MGDPAERRHSLSKSSKVSEAGWWMTATIVRQPLVSSLMALTTKKAAAASRPGRARQRGGCEFQSG
jgi:hypothetical protein